MRGATQRTKGDKALGGGEVNLMVTLPGLLRDALLEIAQTGAGEHGDGGARVRRVCWNGAKHANVFERGTKRTKTL